MQDRIISRRHVPACQPSLGRPWLVCCTRLSGWATWRCSTSLLIGVHKLLSDRNGGRADGTWERWLNAYLRPNLRILDDFGLKSTQPPGPEDLYDVINERHERGSILLTSNRAPSKWSYLAPAWISPDPLGGF